MSDDTRPASGRDGASPYRDTLFLPHTDFPMRAGLAQREPAWLERWARTNQYARQRTVARGRPRFVLHDGPPYANGHLHIGHALNKILKDMVYRSQQMLGHDSRYIPGWDCHGLPIEWKVEEAFEAGGRAKREVPVAELRAACRAFADKWIDIQRTEFRRLGVGGDWGRAYTTMAFANEAAIVAEFHKFVMNGALYRGSKPVMWSSVENTALAEAEIEYHERVSPTVTVRFPVLPGDSGLPQGVAIPIWTTTPWTIPSNRGIAFSAALSYGIYRITAAPEENWAAVGTRLVLADALAQSVMREARVEGFVREGDAVGLEGAVCAHPLRGAAGADGFWDYAVPVHAAGFVTGDAGTGFVHVAPSHGADDYEFGRTHQLEVTHNVDANGCFAAAVPLFAGHAIYRRDGSEGTANGVVTEALRVAGGLVARGRLRHSYPHSWRSKAPLIFRNTPQWFIGIDRPLGDGLDTDGETIRARALHSIRDRVRFVPESGRNRLDAMMETRPDWVVSRQRAWGVPLACFVNRADDVLLRDGEVNARIVAAFREEGADAWFADDAAARFLGPGRDPAAWEKIDDILDVWFESGSTHAFVLEADPEGGQWPAALYLEGTDQHRGWFHSSLLESCGTRGRAPYGAVLTHGFVLDEDGRKMSKSLGNVIAPQEVIDTRGADILRFWIASADYTQDLRIGPGILKSTTESYRRLRNTLRFLLGNLAGWEEAEAVAEESMPPLERWVLHRLVEVDGMLRTAYGNFAFQRAFSGLFNFCTNDLSAFYFDIRKDALYCDDANSLRRRACRTVLDRVFRRVATWLAPALCFTAEEAWVARYGEDDSVSVHLETFPESPCAWNDPELAARMDQIRAVRRVVTGAIEEERRANRLGGALEAGVAVHVEDAALEALLAECGFAEICLVSQAAVRRGTGPGGAFRLDAVPGVAVAIGPADGARCARCWRVLPEVGQAARPDLCHRCDSVIAAL